MTNEASRTTLFLKYSKAMMKESFAFEAKICKTPSLPFSAVKDHQERNLLQVKHSILNYKISDIGFDQKPWDGFQIMGLNAYVIIFWYNKRNDKRITIIDIDSWIEEKKTSKRRSLLYERSCEIGKCVSF